MEPRGLTLQFWLVMFKCLTNSPFFTMAQFKQMVWHSILETHKYALCARAKVDMHLKSEVDVELY